MKNILLLFTALINLSVFGQIGTVTTYTGSTVGIQNGPLANALFRSPAGVAFDSNGNMYVADYDNNVIRKIDTAGNVSTYAGIPSVGVGGYVDGPASSARFNKPYDIAIDAVGNLFVTDETNGRIRKIDTSGNVTTIAGQGLGNGVIDGNGTSASLGFSGSIVVDNAGNIYFTDNKSSFVDGKLRKIDTSGNVTTIAGVNNGNYNDGQANTVTISQPYGIELDGNGNLYFTEVDRNRIRRLNLATNAVTTLAGSGTAGSLDGIGLSATMNGPIALSLDNNSLYFNDRYSHNVRKLNLLNNQVITLAGSGTASFANGTGNAASFNIPIGIAVKNNEIFIGDLSNQRIRKITLSYPGGNSCANSTVLSEISGTIDIGTISGTIPASPVCYSFSQANPNANWWSFTPTQNGLLDITTVTAQNAATVDTRLSIFTGTCSALTCFAGSDNVSTTDLRSNLNDLILQAGTTYYFVFDDKVSDNAAVNFFYEFTPQTCFRPNTVTFGTPTENTINVNWTAPTVGNTNPSSYTIQIGPRDYVVDSSAALQTIPTLVANSTTITGLTANTVYDIYIKSNCSASDSSVWYGPFRTTTEFTAVTPSYSENFDSDVSFLFVGWNRSGGTISTLWRTYTGSTPFVSSGTTSIYSPVEPALNTPTNTFAYTRKLNLTAGQNYIVSFMARQFIASGTTTSPSLKVSYTSNLDYTNPATHNQIVNLTNTSATAYTSENHNFSVTNSGQYRIAFKNDVQRTAGTGTAWLMLDSVTVSSALSTENFSKTALQLYPNPVLDDITIQNDDNLEIQTINIVDLNGRVVKEFKYSALNNNLMNISELESGIYIVNLITSSQQVLSKKIIKE